MTLSKFFKNTFLVLMASLVLTACATTKKVTPGQMQGDVYTGTDSVGYLAEGVKEIVDELEEEVPLNDPFAGNEGTSGSLNTDIPEEEQEDQMSLYNFKLAGLISGKDNSYISLVKL